MEIHCLKCKKKNEANDVEKTTLNKTGRPALKGTCSVCNSSVIRILSKESAAEYEAAGTL